MEGIIENSISLFLHRVCGEKSGCSTDGNAANDTGLVWVRRTLPMGVLVSRPLGTSESGLQGIVEERLFWNNYALGTCSGGTDPQGMPNLVGRLRCRSGSVLLHVSRLPGECSSALASWCGALTILQYLGIFSNTGGQLQTPTVCLLFLNLSWFELALSSSHPWRTSSRRRGNMRRWGRRNPHLT